MSATVCGNCKKDVVGSLHICGASKPGDLDEHLMSSTIASQSERDARAVDHPAHYNAGKIEAIDAIEDWQLGFHLGNVVKYVARAGHKGKYLEDLKKARWYLDRYINVIEPTKAENASAR